jgi:hypothetical protein
MTQRHFRKQHDAGKHCDGMNVDRIKQLDDIGFVWTAHDARWDAMYDALKDFKKLNGHTNVNQRDPDNKVRVYFYCDCQCGSVFV